MKATLIDDGTLDTVFEIEVGGLRWRCRYDADYVAAYRHPATGELDVEAFVEDHEEDFFERGESD